MIPLNPNKTLVVFSGGLDSTTLLYDVRNSSCVGETVALSVFYGQRHSKELDHAEKICRDLGVDHFIAQAPVLGAMASSALTSGGIDLPLGHYEEESMKATVVPNRNMILLSLAAAYAIEHGCGIIVYGAHAGDHAIYPDCRTEFVDAMRKSIALCHSEPILLLAPFVEMRKEDIVIRGEALGVPFADTWSCYAGGEFHCGECGTCVERKEAFEIACVPDPTTYA